MIGCIVRHNSMNSKARLDNDKSNPCQPLTKIVAERQWNNGFVYNLVFIDEYNNELSLGAKCDPYNWHSFLPRNSFDVMK